MKSALHAEWTKFRTVTGPTWLLLAAVVAAITISLAAAAGVPGPGQDPVKVSLTGIELAQAVVAVLAVTMIGDEYGTGMIRITLAATPRRVPVLLAKAALLGGAVLAAGVVSVPVCLLAGRAILAGHGYHAVSLGAGPTLRAAGGSALYLVLIALLALGIATVVRDSATAIGITLGLLYLFPILAGVVTDPHWKQRITQIGPSTAGLSIRATRDLHALPISPWNGLGVAAAWAVAALVAGGLVLRFRDA